MFSLLHAFWWDDNTDTMESESELKLSTFLPQRLTMIYILTSNTGETQHTLPSRPKGDTGLSTWAFYPPQDSPGNRGKVARGSQDDLSTLRILPKHLHPTTHPTML